MDSPQEGPWNYVHQVGHHHELSLQESWNYVLLTLCTCFTNQSESSRNTNIMHKQQSYISCFPIHTASNHISGPFTPQHKTCPSLAQARRPRSSKRSSRSCEPLLSQARARAVEQRPLWILAQASPFSPRRDHASLKMKGSRLGDSLRRKAWASLCQSRLGKTHSLGQEKQCPPLFTRENTELNTKKIHAFNNITQSNHEHTSRM